MGGKWHPIAREYDPLKAGSLDGTDTVPHDRAVWRALQASYTPPADIDCHPSKTLFAGRLHRSVGQERLHQVFSKFGVVEQAWLIRDVVTGASRGYGFVQFRRERDAVAAYNEANGIGIEFEGCPALVDWEAGHKLKGWVPRRLGGGWGGRKEAGQLRFGCKIRPWRKPIIIPSATSRINYPDQDEAPSRKACTDLDENMYSKNSSKHNRSSRQNSPSTNTDKRYQYSRSREYKGSSNTRRYKEKNPEQDRYYKNKSHEEDKGSRSRSHKSERGYDKDQSSRERHHRTHKERNCEQESLRDSEKTYDRERSKKTKAFDREESRKDD